MGCNPTRQNCSADGVFAAVASAGCGQFMNPANFQAEQIIYDSAFKDIINSFGVPIDYYINTFNLSAADTLYGEHPTAIFYGPVSMMMYVELSENAINLSKFGFASDDEMTGFIHIETFTDTMSGVFNYSQYGQVSEPKSGDLINLTPLGCDRPNGRGSKIFEITERVDQDVATLNPLLGHYVYRIKSKRYEGSFEPGAPTEPQNQQVFENSFSGILSANIPGVVPSEAKSYPGDIDLASKETVFNMDANNTDIYGVYY